MSTLGIFLSGIFAGAAGMLILYMCYVAAGDARHNHRRRHMFVSPQAVKRVTAVQLTDPGFYEPKMIVDPIIRNTIEV